MRIGPNLGFCLGGGGGSGEVYIGLYFKPDAVGFAALLNAVLLADIYKKKRTERKCEKRKVFVDMSPFTVHHPVHNFSNSTL